MQSRHGRATVTSGLHGPTEVRPGGVTESPQGTRTSQGDAHMVQAAALPGSGRSRSPSRPPVDPLGAVRRRPLARAALHRRASSKACHLDLRRRVGPRVGPRRPPPARLPLPLIRRLRGKRAHHDAVVADPRDDRGPPRRVVAFGIAKLIGEPQVDKAIAFEEFVAGRADRRRLHARPRPRRRVTTSSSPESQQNFAGLGTGCADLRRRRWAASSRSSSRLAYGRLGTFTARGTAALLGLLGFVSVFLVPS